MARAQKLPTRVRYRTKSIERSLAFYVRLGFKVEFLDPPESAEASMGGLTLFLTGVDESDWRKLLGNRRHRPSSGIVIEVDNLEAHVESLKRIGFRFRHEIEQGSSGGKRMRLEDPDGNPVDLVERTRARTHAERVEVLRGRAAAMMSAAHGLLSPRHALPRR